MNPGILILTAISLLPTICKGQGVIPAGITAQHSLNRMSGVNGIGRTEILMELPVPPPKLVGDTYINEEWQPGSILMTSTDEVISGIPIRYDLLKNELELKTDQGVKVIPDQQLKSFAWTNSAQHTSYFVNGKTFTLDGAQLVGCVEVLSDGATLLIKKTELELKKADYNVAMSVGNQNHEYIKKERYYYSHGTELIPLPRTKKKIEEIFANDVGPEFGDSFSARNEQDLKKLFDFYNHQS